MNFVRRDKNLKFDWQKAKQRLAHLAAAVEVGQHLSAERVKVILDERARALARLPMREVDTSEVLEVATFGLANEQFAIEARFVREVIRCSEITPVPGGPTYLMGVTNLRGEVLAVMDLRQFFAVAATEFTGRSRVIVLGVDRPEFGVLADTVDEVTTLRIDRVLEVPGAVAGVGREYMRGVTADALMVLDGASLLRDSRLYIDQGEEAGG